VLIGKAVQGKGKEKKRCWSTVSSPGARRDGPRSWGRPDGDTMAIGMLQARQRGELDSNDLGLPGKHTSARRWREARRSFGAPRRSSGQRGMVGLGGDRG
jgi:hypothetical protein